MSDFVFFKYLLTALYAAGATIFIYAIFRSKDALDTFSKYLMGFGALVMLALEYGLWGTHAP